MTKNIDNTPQPIQESDLDGYLKKLKDELAYTQNLIAELHEEFAQNQDSPTDEVDQATLEMERSEIRNRIARLNERKKKISFVIENFDDEFGFCSDCGIDMDKRRLNIDATYTRCVECEERYQKIRRQYA